jgi:diaminohydroxyphosphoribosylaminopyrimidine deaminase/5-amino-6-(5-phosphoribosylamino)uracil reductase
MPRAEDRRYLEEALRLAAKGEGHTRPNPPVGALIVKDGKIVGRGYHRRAGGDHAEVAAIKNARRRGFDLAGSTIYVTLEPCSRPGRVGACTDAIAAAGIAEVVYAAGDPNPKNRNRAARVLRKAGIKCRRVPMEGAERIIRPFAKHVLERMPFVTVKIAMSLDGRICDVDGESKWISSKAARKLTGAFRRRADAIMVGAETVRKDNPSLLPHDARNDDLLRVVVSRSGRLSKTAQIFTDGKNPTRVFKLAKGESLRSVLETLAEEGVMWVFCEGGLALARSLAQEGLVDEWITVLAPTVIGTRPIAEKVDFKGGFAAAAPVVGGDVIARCSCLRD